MRLLAILLPTLTLLPTVALAETTSSEIRIESFEDELVAGDYLTPLGDGVLVDRHHRGRSLIRVRENFRPEMMRNVEDL